MSEQLVDSIIVSKGNGERLWIILVMVAMKSLDSYFSWVASMMMMTGSQMMMMMMMMTRDNDDH